MRDLRNEISHEYRLDDITEIFEAVMEYSDKLIEVIENTRAYVRLHY
ncbi:MAG: capsule biosynthesis protein [Nitrospirae bacterium]|nr:capsule biosynthesis protein [Nitrospirota bacterium]